MSFNFYETNESLLNKSVTIWPRFQYLFDVGLKIYLLIRITIYKFKEL